MLTLPKRIIQVLREFEEVFSERVWEWAKVLLIGAILAPGERTVASILHVMLGRQAVPELSSRAQSRQVVESRAQSPVAGVAGSPVCSRKRASDSGH